MKSTRFSVILRTRKATSGKKIKTWAYCLIDPKTGCFSKSHQSVMALAKKMKIDEEFRFREMNRVDATRIVTLAVERGLVGSHLSSTDEFLIPYVTKIWTYDLSPWVAEQNARRVYPLSRGYVQRALRAFQLHAEKHIKVKVTLSEFSSIDAVNLQQSMHKAGVSPENLNDVMQAISTAYKYAVRHGATSTNPVIGLEPYQSKTTEPEPLTRQEAKSLLERMKENAHLSVLDTTCYLATSLAVHGGLREGEIRALKIEHIEPLIISGQETDYYVIRICMSWDDMERKAGPTKGKYLRYTAIPKELAEDLIANGEANPFDSGFIFFTPLSAKGPISKNCLQNHLYDSLNDIGISESDRIARKLTFHSLRHFFATEMKMQARKTDAINAQIRQAIGHKSVRVDEEIYTHVTKEELLTIGILSEHILDTEAIDDN